MSFRKFYVYRKTSNMGFLGWLTLLFIALKLTGFITWTWIWVLSPIWISALIALSIFAMFFLFWPYKSKK